MNEITLKTTEEISAFYRGTIIQSAIDVELRMDIIIGRFLSNNNQERTIDAIGIFDNAESIGFHAKNLAIQYILKKYFMNYLKENKTLLNDINDLIKIRNYIAHKRPDMNKNDYSILSWSKSKKNSVGSEYFEINKESCYKYQNLAAEVYIKLIYLEGEVIKKVKGE
jgi:hypothetical protein